MGRWGWMRLAVVVGSILVVGPSAALQLDVPAPGTRFSRLELLRTADAVFVARVRTVEEGYAGDLAPWDGWSMTVTNARPWRYSVEVLSTLRGRPPAVLEYEAAMKGPLGTEPHLKAGNVVLLALLRPEPSNLAGKPSLLGAAFSHRLEHLPQDWRERLTLVLQQDSGDPHARAVQELLALPVVKSREAGQAQLLGLRRVARPPAVQRVLDDLIDDHLLRPTRGMSAKELLALYRTAGVALRIETLEVMTSVGYLEAAEVAREVLAGLPEAESLGWETLPYAALGALEAMGGSQDLPLLIGLFGRRPALEQHLLARCIVRLARSADEVLVLELMALVDQAGEEEVGAWIQDHPSPRALAALRARVGDEHETHPALAVALASMGDVAAFQWASSRLDGSVLGDDYSLWDLVFEAVARSPLPEAAVLRAQIRAAGGRRALGLQWAERRPHESAD